MSEEKQMAPRVPISVTLPKELIDWLDKKVEDRLFANRSHGVELAVMEAMKKDKKG